MPGSIKGGKKAAAKNMDKEVIIIDGEPRRIKKGTFYKHLGAAGGRESRGGGFAKDRELARRAGKKGGKTSSRLYR